MTCANYIGNQYDPTNACLYSSESSYCTNGVLCDGYISGTTYAYDCDWDADRYSCAPGDLAGKFGMITDPDSTPLVVNYAGDDSLIPMTDSLVGKVMLIHCADGTPVACAPIVDSATTTQAPADATKQYVATFTAANNGIDGTVTVNDGQIEVDLDLSSEPALVGGFATCTDGGLKWHIHNSWTHSDNDDKLEGMCGASYTGGHYDPWNACGSASGSAYCGTSYPSSSSLTGLCLDTDEYSPAFGDDPFSAEVGDWSGKYGLLELDEDNMISASFSSFWEVMSAEVAGLSIVFHCNGGARAFCAPFVASTDDVTSMDMTQSSSGKTVFANFQAALTTESVLTLFPNGDVDGDLDASVIYSNSLGCDSLAYGIFEPGANVLLTESSVECDTAVGYAYDPTNSCVDFSGSPFCDAGALCDESTASYNCDWDADRYSCAPGDLSGKFGLITDPANGEKHVHYESDDSLTPVTDDLVGKVMAIYCPYADSSTPIYLACAPIEELVADDSGVKGMSFVMAVVVSLVALL